MELALFVYLAGVVGSFGAVFFTASIVCLVATIIFWIIVLVGVAEENWSFSDFSRYLRNASLGVFFLGVVTAVVPSEKTMYLVLAGYTTQQVVQSETGDKVVKVVNAKLDEYLEDMAKKESK